MVWIWTTPRFAWYRLMLRFATLISSLVGLHKRFSQVKNTRELLLHVHHKTTINEEKLLEEFSRDGKLKQPVVHRTYKVIQQTISSFVYSPNDHRHIRVTMAMLTALCCYWSIRDTPNMRLRSFSFIMDLLLSAADSMFSSLFLFMHCIHSIGWDL